MRVQQLIVGRFKQAFHKMFRKTVPHFAHVKTQEYLKDGTKTLVVSERPLSD